MSPRLRLFLICLGWGVCTGMVTGAVIGAVLGSYTTRVSELAVFAAGYGLVFGGLFAIVPTALGGLVVVAVVGRHSHSNLRRDLARAVAAVIGVASLVIGYAFRGELGIFAMVNVIAAPMLYLAWRSVAKAAQAVA